MSEAPPEQPVQSRPRPNRKPFLVLLFMLLLAGVAWFVVQKVSDMSSIQDCVMAGRNNCAPIDTGR